MKKSITKYIPENLNIEELILRNPPPFKMENDKLIHIISLLNEIPAYDHSKYEKNGWIPIHSTLVQKAGIRNFRAYWMWLVKCNVIETDNLYVPGEKARGYRFTEEYRTPIKRVQITNKNIIKALDRDSHVRLGSSGYPKLKRWFNRDLEINEKAASEYLWLNYKADKALGVLTAREKLNTGLINIEKLTARNYYFTVDSSVGRLHTNLTNIKSELRNFLTYDGQELVSIDFKNSQPTLSTLLLKPDFWKGKYESLFGYSYLIEDAEKKKNEDSFTSFPSSFSSSTFPLSTSKTSPSIMLAEYNQPLDTSDVIIFIKYVKNGLIYEFIQKQIEQRKTNVIPIRNRKDLKALVFTVLFTDNRYLGQAKAEPKRLFKEIFPTVYDVFAHVKRNKSETLAILLQTIESKLILDRIAKRISKERPNLPIFTIHDSIATTKGNEEYVKSVMLKEADDLLGFVPKVSIEFWTPDNIRWDELKQKARTNTAA